MFRFVIVAVLIVTVCGSGRSLQGDDVTLTVEVARPMHAISPRLYGIFLEDINFGADGGLSAELVKNGGFEFPNTLMGWKKRGNSGKVSIAHSAPRRATNPNYLTLQVTKDVAISNEGFRGIGLKGGEEYLFNAWARTDANKNVRLTIRLVGSRDQVLTESQLEVSGSDWQDVAVALKPVATEPHARIEIALETPGTVDLDMVSLSPADTWQGRPRGLRKDLVQLLADLQPAFFRFPGGCIVEGSALKYRYQWKHTIGDLADRQLLFNRWNSEFGHRPTPDYYQSFAVGFYEYFVLSEDLGAEPMPIINCGMACQFNSGELVPMDALQPYIQDALDLIEFANGPVTSRWGAKRAELGHPEPFGMKMLGVGNEQWGPQYIERYKAFADVLREKHPEIELIAGSGPFPGDKNYHYAWPALRALDAAIIDEHCYAMPDWFLKAATRYDGFERNGPKVFMGEYAAQSVDISSPDNRNNLRCALAEAAFMTGMERNSDVVVMSSYAPLLGHEDAWQWRPNLIWFDNLTSYGTPNYYVQQLFSLNRGDEVLPLEIADTRPGPRPAGRIGLATYRSAAEFKDIQVIAGENIVFDGNSLDDLAEATIFRGQWSVDKGTIKQGNRGGDARLLIGDPSWSDYTLSLKARATDGDEGFMIIFRNSGGGSYLVWNVGGWRNSAHGIQAHLASHSTDMNTVTRESGTIDQGRWYDVKIELAGSKVTCYLDGELIHNVDIPAPELARVYATASTERSSGGIILKVVNADDGAAITRVKLKGTPATSFRGEAIILAGDPQAANTIENPATVKPQRTAIYQFDAEQQYEFPPHSLTVLRLQPSP